MQIDATSDAFKFALNLIPTATLCTIVWAASRLITKVNNMSVELRRLRYRVHKLNNIITVLAGKRAVDLIEEDEDEKEI